MKPFYTFKFTYFSKAKAIHNKRALIINHDDTIAWALQNRERIDADKLKTKENKETKAHQTLGKQIAAAESQTNILSLKAAKAERVKNKAEKALLESNIAVESNKYQENKRKLELAFDEEKKAEPNKARKLLLETRFNVNLLELAYDYYEKTSMLTGDFEQ